MTKLTISAVIAATFLTGCASKMGTPEWVECMQPNRRVVVDIIGTRLKPPPKPPADKPAADKPAADKPAADKVAAAKPEAKPEAKPDAKPAADKPAADKPAAKPPAKPEPVPVELSGSAQGNTAFAYKSAVLKPEGLEDLDDLIKQAMDKKQPLTVGSIIIIGHSDASEEKEGTTALSEARAKAVMDYLISKGLNQKLMFWEGQGSRSPVPVTKFCES